MFCTCCEKQTLANPQLRANVFTSGCVNFKRDSIIRHRNNFHQDVFVSPVVENVTRGIEAGFHKSEQEEAVRIKRLLTECLYLAKKDHSLNSISDRIKTTAYQLDESLGSAY